MPLKLKQSVYTHKVEKEVHTPAFPIEMEHQEQNIDSEAFPAHQTISIIQNPLLSQSNKEMKKVSLSR
jgi:hypothetical protein